MVGRSRGERVISPQKRVAGPAHVGNAEQDFFRTLGPYPDVMAPLSDDDLDAIQQRCDAATASPWWAWIEGRDGVAGDTFIGLGGDPQLKDLYLSHGVGEGPVSESDVDFIAHARQDLPALLAEVRRLRPIGRD